MKKFLFVVGIVVVSSMVFGAGYLFGTSSDFTTAMMNTGLFEEITNNTSENMMILEMIADDKLSEAVSYLNLKLDGQILGINNLLPGIENEGNKKVANYILLKAAKYRTKYPAAYPDKDIDKMIKEILLKVQKEKH